MDMMLDKIIANHCASAMFYDSEKNNYKFLYILDLHDKRMWVVVEMGKKKLKIIWNEMQGSLTDEGMLATIAIKFPNLVLMNIEDLINDIENEEE